MHLPIRSCTSNHCWLFGCIFLFLMTTVDTSMIAQCDDDVTIDIWYGDHQTFGTQGLPQPWINILGNIGPAECIDSVHYHLNDGAPIGFNLGPDLHRLALSGDFNIDLALSKLIAGTNRLEIVAVLKNGSEVGQMLSIELILGKIWPLPYQVDFAKVDDLQQVVQLLDGKWLLEAEGLRTVEPYYDRVICVGDTTWKNYETNLELTVHDWTPRQPGPPTYNVTHFGVAMRWRGHHIDDHQPHRKWYPLGAQGEFLLRANPDSCRWRLLFDRARTKPYAFTKNRNTLHPGDRIKIKTQITTLVDGRSRYRFKQWKVGQEEPSQWDIEGFESDDYPSGALCVVPHHSDVTIHHLYVHKLAQN